MNDPAPIDCEPSSQPRLNVSNALCRLFGAARPAIAAQKDRWPVFRLTQSYPDLQSVDDLHRALARRLTRCR